VSAHVSARDRNPALRSGDRGEGIQEIPCRSRQPIKPSDHQDIASIELVERLAQVGAVAFGTARRLTKHLRECQKPGALRRELDCLVAEASVQQRGSDLKHSMGASGRPAHLPALVHARVHQLIDGALGP